MYIYKSNIIIKKIVRRFQLYYKVWKWNRSESPNRLLRAFAKEYPEAFFIQIGSNDGVQMDPLRREILRTRWKGVLVEPLPHIFDRLRDNYRQCGNRITLKNVGIASKNGVMPFYFVGHVEDAQVEGLPDWYELIGSFDKNVVLSHKNLVPDISDRISVTEVPCVTFETLCREIEVRQVDLLHIDAEGYDYEILKSINFDSMRPILLIYEHLHLGDSDKAECEARLSHYGYEMYKAGMDTWCLYLPGVKESGRRIRRVWASLKKAGRLL